MSRARGVKGVAACAAIFLPFYPAVLFLWLGVEPYYGRACAAAGGYMSSLVGEWVVNGVESGRSSTEIVFAVMLSTGRGMAEVTSVVRIKHSAFLFNVPLTLAILAGIFPVLSLGWRHVAEVLLLLAGVHLVYCFSACNLHLMYGQARVGVGVPCVAGRLLLEFLFAFVDSMLVRFEPFLVAAYLWLREGRRRSPCLTPPAPTPPSRPTPPPA